MIPVVFDTGALIALERRHRPMLALADTLVRHRRNAYVPAGVVAQYWRASPRQHSVARLLRRDAVAVDPMSEQVAFAVGALLARTGTSDVVDGHVVLLARRLRATVITSDPTDIAALDPTLTLIVV